MRSMQKANSPCNFPSENHYDPRKTPIKTGFDNPNKAAKTGSEKKKNRGNSPEDGIQINKINNAKPNKQYLYAF